MKARTNLIFFSLLFISFLFLILSTKFPFNGLKNFLKIPLKPFNLTVDFISFSIGNKNIFIEQENNLLEKTLTISRMEYLKRENEKLKELLNLKQRLNEKFIFSEIISTNKITGEFFTIDKGKINGIDIGMPVISTNGVVGKIVEVYKNNSIVETFNSPNFRIGVMDKNKDQFMLCYYYKRGLLKVENVQYDVKLNPGDTLYTSGFGKIFPENIPVGTILKIEYLEDGDFFYLLKPVENIFSLKHLCILQMDKEFYRNEFENIRKEFVSKIGWFSIYQRVIE